MRDEDNKLGTSRFDTTVAEIYDAFFGEMPGWELATDLLASLADDGPVLELGIGTGRVALPLVERGVEVHGLDASEAMVAKLRSKPRGESIPVSIGDMTVADPPANDYSLAFVVFNTFFDLLTQDDQLDCFSNVHTMLTDGGRFLLHCFVPDLERYTDRSHTSTRKNDQGHILTEQSTIDPVTQIIDSRHVVDADGVKRSYPVRLRYCWPSELDLMARFTGFELENRWADWGKNSFTSESGFHVSVYRKLS